MSGTDVQLALPGLLQPTLLGVGGCSGSGKTTLARELAERLEGVLFPLDTYYRDLSHLSLQERAHYNFDHPDALESGLFIQQLRELAEGRSIDRPVYDFANHIPVPGLTEHVEPRRWIVVEGILALHFAQLRQLFALKVFVDAPHDVCLARRIHRDVRERGRTEAGVRAQFDSTTRPMADCFVLPSATHADLTVLGTESLDWSVEAVLGELRRRGLL